MVAEMKDAKDKDILNTITSIPETPEELQAQLNSLKLEEDDNGEPIKLTLVSSDIDLAKGEKKTGFFTKIKTFFSRSND